MKTNNTEVKFNVEDLPAWAQKNYCVVFGCIEDYAFRCDICAAETTQERKRLSRLAQEKWVDEASDWYFQGEGWNIVN